MKQTLQRVEVQGILSALAFVLFGALMPLLVLPLSEPIIMGLQPMIGSALSFLFVMLIMAFGAAILFCLPVYALARGLRRRACLIVLWEIGVFAVLLALALVFGAAV